MTPLARVPLTLATALAFHVAMSPPTCPASPTDTSGDRRAKIYASARFITAMASKGLYWASAITDTLVLLAPHVPTSLRLLISIPPKGPLVFWIRALGMGLPVPLMTIVGTTLTLTGTLLRYAAYQTLGQFYACPNLGAGPCSGPSKSRRARHAHALITSGPYAFVRHPGYAGLLLSTTGLVVLHLDLVCGMDTGSGGVVESPCGIGRVSMNAGMRTIALVCAVLGTVGAMWRIRDEERGLRARFKWEWEAWAERVRYRLIPGVY